MPTNRLSAKPSDSLFDARRAIAGLAVEVPGEVWDDVQAKTSRVFDEYEAMRAALEAIAADGPLHTGSLCVEAARKALSGGNRGE